MAFHSSQGEPCDTALKREVPNNSDEDVEKGAACNTSPVSVREEKSKKDRIAALGESCQSLWKWLASWGVELRGVLPVTVDERTDTNVLSLFFLWFSISCNLLPVSTGILATLTFGLSLRDAALVIIFFSLICVIPPAYLSIVGPKTGLRQLIQGRYSFGLYLVNIIVILNLATVSGFTIINCVIGGQTLSAVNTDDVSVNVGIVIIAIIALVISFFGYKVLHQFERYYWIPTLICIIITLGFAGKHLSNQATPPPADASSILSFGGLIAGYFIPWGTLSSDFCTYLSPKVSSTRVFMAVYLGLFVPTVPLMILGAAIGAAVPNIPSWAEAYETGSVGGMFAAMLIPAGGFGKFITVLLSFSTLGNIAASIYSITLNFQIIAPVLALVPRALLSIVFVAILIPLSMRAATTFFDSLHNFVAVIAYWAAAVVAVMFTEHFVFRKGRYDSYDPAFWNVREKLPSGIAAIGACALSFGLVVPCMSQTWFVGPIAKTTGDIGFEVAFVLSGLLYLPLRSMEIRWRGGLQ